MSEGTPPARRALNPGDEDAMPGVRPGMRRGLAPTEAEAKQTFFVTLGLWVAGSVALGITFVLVVRGLTGDLHSADVPAPAKALAAKNRHVTVPVVTPPPPLPATAPLAAPSLILLRDRPPGDRIVTPGVPERTFATSPRSTKADGADLGRARAPASSLVPPRPRGRPAPATSTSPVEPAEPTPAADAPARGAPTADRPLPPSPESH